MITKRHKIIALPLLMLSAITANAATEHEAVQACSEAMKVSVEKKVGAEVKLTVDSSGTDPGQRLSPSTLFHLDAVDAATDTVVGRYECVVSRGAKVRRLIALSLNAPDAKARARS